MNRCAGAGAAASLADRNVHLHFAVPHWTTHSPEPQSVVVWDGWCEVDGAYVSAHYVNCRQNFAIEPRGRRRERPGQGLAEAVFALVAVVCPAWVSSSSSGNGG